MDIKVYTTSGCFYCNKLQELLQRAKLEYDIINVVSNKIEVENLSDSNNFINRTTFSSLHPGVEGFPFVVIDEKPIGSLVQTAKFLLEKGLVSANKG